MALQIVRWVLCLESTQRWIGKPSTSQADNHSSGKGEKITKRLNTVSWHSCVLKAIHRIHAAYSTIPAGMFFDPNKA